MSAIWVPSQNFLQVINEWWRRSSKFISTLNKVKLITMHKTNQIQGSMCNTQSTKLDELILESSVSMLGIIYKKKYFITIFL